MGRKSLSDSRKYDRLVVRLTDTERAALDSAAAMAGLPTSTWARELLLNAAANATSRPTVAKPTRKKPSQNA